MLQYISLSPLKKRETVAVVNFVKEGEKYECISEGDDQLECTSASSSSLMSFILTSLLRLPYFVRI